MKLSISQLQKQAKAAPKFMLMAFNDLTGNYVFVADSAKVSEKLTENECNAAMFSYGFDDEAMKEKAWTLETGFNFMAIPA